MEFLQSIDPGTGVLLAVLCAGLCAVGVVLVVGLQVLGGAIHIFSGAVELVVQIMAGGPIAWCGCGVVVAGCIGCAVLSLVLLSNLSACDTSPTNLCVWLGLAG